jgi:hypothetical protein
MDTKWRFALALPKTEWLSGVRQRRHKCGIWRRRFWEHAIRDEEGLRRHVDYIHYNPVKHGWVSRVADWPYSTFRRYVQRACCPCIGQANRNRMKSASENSLSGTSKATILAKLALAILVLEGRTDAVL